MSQDDHESIADAAAARSAARVFRVVLVGALALGAFAAWYYWAAGLTLSHYDARAHLVVARRVTDSLTPGWRQFGAVWLPFPHLLNATPALWDWAYRTGAIAVALSVVSFSVGLAAIARTMTLRTRSVSAAAAAVTLAATNPNVLYLEATPMTEPLLFGLTLLSVSLVDDWLHVPTSSRAWRASVVLAMLVLTRYEGWLVAIALVALAIVLSVVRRQAVAPVLWRVPWLAVGCFLVLGWASTGQWLFSTDFFAPDAELLHQPRVVADRMIAGFLELAGPLLSLAAVAGLAALAFRLRRQIELSLLTALVAPAVLPFVAFYSGHPYRIRYLIPIAIAAAIFSGLAVASLPRRLRAVGAIALCMGVLWTERPFDSRAPMVREAQWETPFRLERERVTAALLARDDGYPILASMGSLGHYMHETSRVGLPLKRFLHEGNGDLWQEALKTPRQVVRWILVEEKAEGGDLLAARAREDPAFLEGFDRVIEAGGLALYARTK